MAFIPDPTMRRPTLIHPDRREANTPAVSAAIREAAADWLARRDAGFSTRDELNYAAWLDADPVHRAAADRLGSAWRTLDRPLSTGVADTVLGELARRAQKRRQRRNLMLGAASMVLLVAAGLGWQAVLPAPDSRTTAAASAAVMMPSLQSLPDGSVAELRDGAAIAVEFTDAQRRVVLLRGEAFFKVAKNSARPFVVVAGSVQVRAVGTAFSVDLGKSAVDVLVTEGKVAVARDSRAPTQAGTANPPPEPLLVSAGQRTTVVMSAHQAESDIRPVSDGDLKSRLAWRSPRLEFSGTPLIEAVALLNRHNRVQFTIEDPVLARTRVSGIFGVMNIDAFVRVLEAGFDVESERRGTDEIVLRRKP